MTRSGDRLVVRSISPSGTLGGGVVLEAAARRHTGRPEVTAHLDRLSRGEPALTMPVKVTTNLTQGSRAAAPRKPLPHEAFILDDRLREAGHRPPEDAELGELAAHLSALREAGRVVRFSRASHIHSEALADVQVVVERVIRSEGSISLGRLRDELGTSRKNAQGLLDALDAARITLRLPDDRRLLRRRRLV